MNKKLFLAVMATSLAIPAAVAQVPTDVEASNVANKVTMYANPFKDVSLKHAYYDIIHTMRDEGIINGYQDGTFKPNQTLSREHAATLVVRALELNDIELKKTKPFKQPKDLSTKNAYYADMKLLVEAGLLELDSKGNINPKKELTRGEMARILAVAFDLQVKDEYKKDEYVFADVKGTAYEKAVQALYTNGVTTGFEDNTFKLGQSLTRAHYVVFMYRAMNLDDSVVVKPIPKPEVDKPIPPKPEIPKPQPKPPVSSGEKTDIKYSDLSYKDNKTKIPRPEGYVAGEHEKKNAEIMKSIMAENQHGYRSETSIEASVATEERLRMWAVQAGTTYEEYVKAINWAIDTGKVYDGKTFSVYFNYQGGRFITSGQRNHAN